MFQKRFFVADKEEGTKWWIPITFVQPGGNFSNTYNSIWMTSDEKSKSIEGLPDADTPVIFNVQETGSCVIYTEKGFGHVYGGCLLILSNAMYACIHSTVT